MLNILVPMSGPNRFEGDEFQYPKPLIEIHGRPLIQYVIECLAGLECEKRFIFVVNESDCRRYHLDRVLRLIAGEGTVVIRAQNPTQGAACTALLAIEEIDGEDALLISNSDHVFDIDLNEVLKHFDYKRLDAGIACFDAVHPKWSYARLEADRVVEAAEKRPLSRNAIAGLYYFRHGKDFVGAAMRMIEKRACLDTDGLYYIAPTLNELVLDGKNIGAYHFDGDAYNNLYSPARVREFEQKMLAPVAGRR